jgi:hypothetical protein
MMLLYGAPLRNVPELLLAEKGGAWRFRCGASYNDWGKFTFYSQIAAQ